MKHARLTRLEKLEDEFDPVAALLRQDGLCVLLQAAALLPKRDLDDAELEAAGSFGRLLADARRWQQEADERRHHG